MWEEQTIEIVFLEKIRKLIEKGLSRKDKSKSLKKIHELAIQAKEKSINTLCTMYIDCIIKNSGGALPYGKSIRKITQDLYPAINANCSTVKTY